jgi:hypothetical protein
MIRVIGRPSGVPLATIVNPSPRPPYLSQVLPKPASSVPLLLRLLDGVREVADRQIDVDILHEPPRYREASRLIGYASVELICQVMRAGVQAHPAETS